MRRYQIYLSPNSLAIMDDFRDLTPFKRSELLREAIDRIATGFVDYISQIITAKKPPRYYYLNKLCGFIKDEKKIDDTESIDEIVYHQDNV
ncbi:hypothetical protein HY357_00970 [Candidatus Roizmanbacteria bacterium]|nr:hypothetical protein [Candidatus Roizmanbacteria bacterium]